MASQYDAASNRTRITHPGGAFFAQYTYDALNRADQVQLNGSASGLNLIADYGYDAMSRRTSLVRGNGGTTSYGYTPASRLASLTHDLEGAATANDANWAFGYNVAGQVATRTLVQVYERAVPALNETYARNGLNQYTSVAGAVFAHDARGNLTSDGARTFGYDLENRLTAVSGAASGSLVYDPLGRVRSYTAGGVTLEFLYDGDRLIAEYSAGAVVRRHVHGPGVDEALVTYEGADTANPRWLIADRQGSIIATTTASGTASPLGYGPYGEPSAWSGPGGALLSRFRYTGQAALPELQLYHYKARAYEPRLGRFLQTDPVGYADDLNLYAYVGNDPLNRIDPSGRWFLPLIMRAVQCATNAGCRTATWRFFSALVGVATRPQAGGYVEGSEFPFVPAQQLPNVVTNDQAQSPDQPSGLGDLTNGEVDKIQGVVDDAGRPLAVVGSAAKGTRQEGSDIDYVVGPSSADHFKGKEGELPGIDPKHGIVPGVPNPHQGPAIQFEPGARPRVIPTPPPPPPPRTPRPK